MFGIRRKQLKSLVNKFLSKLGYRIVKSHMDRQDPSFKNYLSTIKTYESLYNEFRCKGIIKNNEMRYGIISRLLGTPPSEAFFIVEAIAKTNSVEGDVCEFGVAQGETSALIANEISPSGKKLHLFDSFEGLPKPSNDDELKEDIFNLGSIESYEGTMSCPEKMVIQRMKDISFDPARYFIHKGFIDKSLETGNQLPEKVSFAYIDFDFYEPTIIVLNYLHDLTPKGAVLIVDDYDYFSTGIKKAVDEFLEEKNRINQLYSIEVPDHIFGHFAVLTKNSN